MGFIWRETFVGVKIPRIKKVFSGTFSRDGNYIRAVCLGLRRGRLAGLRGDDPEGRRLQRRRQDQQEGADDDPPRAGQAQPGGRFGRQEGVKIASFDSYRQKKKQLKKKKK